MKSVDLDAPIERDASGAPVLYLALGAYLQLESLEHGDIERLGEVASLVHEWIGGSLRYGGNSAFQVMRRYRSSELSLMAGHARQLNEIRAIRANVSLTPDDRRSLCSPHDEIEIAAHSAEEPSDASPYSFRFYSELVEDESGAMGKTLTMLRVTVPASFPLPEFHQWVLRLVRAVRLRWASAGYIVSGWEKYRRNATVRAEYAAARHFPGVDPGFYRNSIQEWNQRLQI